LHTNWAIEEVEATACLWAYSTIMNDKSNSELKNSSEKMTENWTFLLLISVQPDFWLFGFGFLGFWGLKNNEKNNENYDGIIDMILKVLESSLIGNVDDLEYADVVLCLSILYTWIYTLQKSNTNSKNIKIMDIILGILFSISYKSKGNPQLFWVDGLIPCFNGVNIGKSMRQKLKSFASGGVSPYR
jgi:hypothetical protein